MLFTITGYMGSGKSTICDILTAQYGFRVVSAGKIFRQMGEKEHANVLEFTRMLADDDGSKVDKYIDEEVMKEYSKVKEGENVIFDSRLAWHFLKDTFNIFIVVSPYQAALRTYLTRKNEDEKYANLQATVDGLVERRVLENRRYKKVYGINCEDLNNYDLVIDTTHISALEASEIIMNCYNKKVNNEPYEKLWISPEFVFPTLTIDCIDSKRVDGYLDRIYKREELEKVKLIRIHDALFIEDGHNRIIAYNLAKIRLINPVIVMSEDDFNDEGVMIKKALSITEKDIRDWESMNGFSYNYLPKIITKKRDN